MIFLKVPSSLATAIRAHLRIGREKSELPSGDGFLMTASAAINQISTRLSSIKLSVNTAVKFAHAVTYFLLGILIANTTPAAEMPSQ